MGWPGLSVQEAHEKVDHGFARVESSHFGDFAVEVGFNLIMAIWQLDFVGFRRFLEGIFAPLWAAQSESNSLGINLGLHPSTINRGAFGLQKYTKRLRSLKSFLSNW